MPSVHHPTEKVSKSTAIHAQMLAPDDVVIHEFPEFPSFDASETVVLYPCDVCARLGGGAAINDALIG
jgi:hypothetical protein